MEGVHLGTDADAHPPRENTVFAEKLRKGVPKSASGVDLLASNESGARTGNNDD